MKVINVSVIYVPHCESSIITIHWFHLFATLVYVVCNFDAGGFSFEADLSFEKNKFRGSSESDCESDLSTV